MTVARNRLFIDRRSVTNYVMTAVCASIVVLALVPLASLLWLVVSRGARSLATKRIAATPISVTFSTSHDARSGFGIAQKSSR